MAVVAKLAHYAEKGRPQRLRQQRRPYAGTAGGQGQFRQNCLYLQGERGPGEARASGPKPAPCSGFGEYQKNDRNVLTACRSPL
jgi:hypothetical protein